MLKYESTNDREIAGEDMSLYKHVVEFESSTPYRERHLRNGTICFVGIQSKYFSSFLQGCCSLF